MMKAYKKGDVLFWNIKPVVLDLQKKVFIHMGVDAVEEFRAMSLNFDLGRVNTSRMYGGISEKFNWLPGFLNEHVNHDRMRHQAKQLILSYAQECLAVMTKGYNAIGFAVLDEEFKAHKVPVVKWEGESITVRETEQIASADFLGKALQTVAKVRVEDCIRTELSETIPMSEFVGRSTGSTHALQAIGILDRLTSGCAVSRYTG